MLLKLIPAHLMLDLIRNFQLEAQFLWLLVKYQKLIKTNLMPSKQLKIQVTLGIYQMAIINGGVEQ